MPRTRMTRSGDAAQSIGSVPGQRYGEGVAQEEMQQSMPAPDRGGPVPAGPEQGAPGGAPPDLAALLGQAPLGRMMESDPNIPVTAGLPNGPGPGPEALQMMPSTPLSRWLRTLADQSGDDYFRQLAERAGL